MERRQSKADPIHRMINTDTVRNKFLEVGTNTTTKSLDPCYEEWELIDKPFDARGIIQKILDVSPEYDSQMFEIFARKIGTIKKQLLRTNSQARGAYLYRVFEACEETFIRIINKQIQDHRVEPALIDEFIEILVNSAKSHLDDWGKDYEYPFKSEGALRDTIYELFDTCYLAFD